MLSGKRVFVAGHRGLVGSAVAKNLRNRGISNIIAAERDELDLLDQNTVRGFFEKTRPEVVFVCAAKVGGIHANNVYRADFIYQNLQIQNNLIWAAHLADVERLIFLGSSCIYPKGCPQPMKEDYLLTGTLEFTNRPYALAKIAGMELINSLVQQYGRKYFSVMPTNLYGPRDNFHGDNSHVMPALIKRFYEAKISNAAEVTLWGTGTPLREFLYSDDCADAIVHLAETVDESFFNDIKQSEQQFYHVNIGSGQEISIADLAIKIADIVEYKGRLVRDLSKPDGTQRKLLDSSRLFGFGWRPKISLDEGIRKSFQWYKESLET